MNGRLKQIEKFFKLKENHTTVKTEVIAGFSTFMTMAYIIQLNPNICTNFAVGSALWNAVFLATILTAFTGTMLMGLLANKPFALAPGMGLNSYFAMVVTTIAATVGVTYEEAYGGGLAIILTSGILFTILTVLKVREKIVDAIPKAIRQGITAGIGLMLVYIGFMSNATVSYEGGRQTILGFFQDGASGTKQLLGADYPIMLLYVITMFVGLFAIIILNHRKVKGSILFGMVIASVLYWLGNVFLGKNPFSSLENASFIPPIGDFVHMTLFKFNYGMLFQMGIMSAILTIISFCMTDMFDTIGTLLGTAKKANMLNQDGKMENMGKAMASDSIATCVGGCIGTPTITVFIESAAGVEEGGRTGLTSVVTACCFLVCMFLAPIATLIPPPATSAALVFVGILMLSVLKEVDYTDFSQSVPIVLMLLFMMVTSGIGNGIGIGLVAHCIIKIFMGKWKELSALTIILALLFAVKFFLI